MLVTPLLSEVGALTHWVAQYRGQKSTHLRWDTTGDCSQCQLGSCRAITFEGFGVGLVRGATLLLIRLSARSKVCDWGKRHANKTRTPALKTSPFETIVTNKNRIPKP